MTRQSKTQLLLRLAKCSAQGQHYFEIKTIFINFRFPDRISYVYFNDRQFKLINKKQQNAKVNHNLITIRKRMLLFFFASIAGQNEIQVQMDSNWLDSHKAFKKPPMSLRQAWNCFLRGLIRFPAYIGVIEESSTICRYYNLKHSQLVSSIHL